ncbi:acyltransferase family protein [Sphingobium olei]|uniref:Acyltransferase family protein n=1 Tax=Sphingobium olei TaxID=420955 RepID=A0ABW3NWQ5_9SPHN
MGEKPHGISYRSDIDGLRAVAVVPVILFHLGLTQFSGGFVGVDVFFVISGYLISAGIQKDIAARQFSLIDFYERRSRRILPALFVMVAFTLLAGWIMFLPDDYKDVGSSAVAVAAFSSNILFWLQTDYFAGAAELKPLLHTWSLAVEEQYYIVLPIFLWGVMRYAKARFIPWTLGLAVLSFVVSIAMVKLAPSAAYYLLPSRAWELLLGALVAQGAVPAIRSNTSAQVASAAGLAMIVASVFLLTEESSFPGLNALWPCLGAALVIHAGASHSNTLAARVLSVQPVLFIGLISYSLYLWHWPLIVFTRYFYLTLTLSPGMMAGVAAGTFAAAVLSWRFVERPFRSRERVKKKAIFVGAGAGIAAFGAFGLALFVTAGVPQRFDSSAPAIARADKPLPGEPVCLVKEGALHWEEDRCFLSRKSGPVTLVWGDSHAYQYRRAIKEIIAPKAVGSILMYATAGCPPIFGVTVNDRPYCRPGNDRVPDIIKTYGVKRVVMFGHWRPMMEGGQTSLEMLKATIAQLRAKGVTVALVGDNPEYDFNNMPLLYQRIEGLTHGEAQDFALPPKYDGEWNRAASKIVPAGAFVDPMEVLCAGHGKGCMVYGNLKPLMSESNHLSYEGAELVAPKLAPLFGTVL